MKYILLLLLLTPLAGLRGEGPAVINPAKPWLGVFSNEKSGFDALALQVDKSGFFTFNTPVMVVGGSWIFDEASSVLTLKGYSVEEENSMQFYFDTDTLSYIAVETGTGKRAEASSALHFQEDRAFSPEEVERYRQIPQLIEKERRRKAARKRYAQERKEKLAREQPEVDRIIRTIQEDPSVVLNQEYHVQDSTPATRALEAALRNEEISFPESVLVQLLEDIPEKNFWTRRWVLARNELSAETLKRFYPEALKWGSTLSYGILVSMIHNPNTPLELVEDLAKKNDVPVGAVYPAKDFVRKHYEVVLSGPEDVSRDEIVHIREYASTFYERKDRSGRGEADLLVAIAKSSHTPSDILHDLSGLENEQLQLAVVSNPDTLPKTLAGMVNSRYRDVKVTICEKPETPQDLLTAFSQDEDPVVRAAAASDPLSPVSLLLKLQDDESYSVKMALVKNPNTPRSVLQKLVHDENVLIKQAARRKLR